MADLPEDNAPGNTDSKAPGREQLKKLEKNGGKTTGATSPSTEAESGVQETGGAEDQVGRGYRPDNPEQLLKLKPSAKGVFKFASQNRGKFIIGGAAAGFITLVIVGFFLLIPFKIQHIVTNLQNRFYGTSENAVDNETNQLFSNYLKKYVLPGITKCKGTIDKTCTPLPIGGTNLVSQLYRGWSTARLENKIAENYGIEFQYQQRTGRYYLKTRTTTGDGIDITDFEKSSGSEDLDNFLAGSNDPEFKQVSRSEVRQAVKDSLSNETRYKQVLYRYKIGRLLEEKYGIKRCIFACNLKDNFSEWKNEKKNAAKAMLAQRVLEPRTQMLGAALACLYSTDCDPTKDVDDSGQCTADVDCEAHGEDVSPTERDIQSKLDALAAKYGSEDVLALYNELAEKGFTQYVIEQILGEEAGQTASKAIPVVGWVNLAATAIGDVSSAPKKIEKLSYVINSATMVETFSMYRTAADEIDDPHAPKDSALIGSLVDSLSGNKSSDMGGSAEAEQTPLYNDLLGSGKGGSADYKCNNGKPVPAGQEVCPEMQLNNVSNIAQALNQVKSIPGFNIISKLASFWNDSVGKVVGILGGLLQDIPGLGSIGDLINQIAGPLIQHFITWIFPAIASDNMSGGRTFDLIAGGADVSGNDFAHNGLGGQELSPQQTATIINQQQQEQNLEDSQQSLFAKIFNANSDNSLATKVALAMPNNASGLLSSVGSVFTNPLNVFGNLFSLNHASAATAAADPFGVTQYGYPANDAIFSTDPETYWQNNCTTDGTTIDMSLPVNQTYHTQAKDNPNPNTQMPENTSTDPCFLIQAAVGSAGALYDSNLLTPDEQASQQ